MTDFHTEKLLEQIEQTKKELNTLTKEKTLTDSEVVKVSQALDVLLNKLEDIEKINYADLKKPFD